MTNLKSYTIKKSSSSTDQVCRSACSTVDAASKKRASTSIIWIKYRIFIGSHINNSGTFRNLYGKVQTALAETEKEEAAKETVDPT
jgi:hypothetical protein